MESLRQTSHTNALDKPHLQYSLEELNNATTPETFIESIDFDTINSIIDSLVEKSGGADQVKNTGYKFDAAKIQVEQQPHPEDPEISGDAFVKDGRIVLYWKKYEGLSNIQNYLFRLHTLIHEAVHIRGAYVVSGVNENAVEAVDGLAVVRTGLKEKFTYGSDQNVYELSISLNEAVTENISIEVFNEYLNRVGMLGALEEFKNMEDEGAYRIDRIILHIVIDAIAQEFGVERDDVWKGFVHMYMNGNEQVVGIFKTIQNELQEADAEALQLLLSPVTNDEIGLSEDDITSIFERNAPHVVNSIRRVVHTYDKEYLTNVLRLR